MDKHIILHSCCSHVQGIQTLPILRLLPLFNVQLLQYPHPTPHRPPLLTISQLFHPHSLLQYPAFQSPPLLLHPPSTPLTTPCSELGLSQAASTLFWRITTFDPKEKGCFPTHPAKVLSFIQSFVLSLACLMLPSLLSVMSHFKQFSVYKKTEICNVNIIIC